MAKEFILIENHRQLEVFLKKYRHRYTPIVYDVYCQAILEKSSIKFLTINNCLTYREVCGIYRQAEDAGELLVSELDRSNEENFYEAFGRRNMMLFRATAKYNLSYLLLPNLMHAMIGLALLLEKNSPCILSYFYFDVEKEIFSVKSPRDYFRPQRALPFFLSALKTGGGVSYVELKGRIYNFHINDYLKMMQKGIKYLIKGLMRRYVNKEYMRFVKDKKPYKNVLAITLDYHLRPVIESLFIAKKFAGIVFKKIFIGNYYVITQKDGKVFVKAEDILDGCDYKTNAFFEINKPSFEEGELSAAAGLYFEGQLYEKIVKFLDIFFKKNIGIMLAAWERLSALDTVYDFDAVMYDSPIVATVEGSVISEYFRQMNKPRISIQHGGTYGCKYYGHAHFDLDYDHCEYFYSYGYLSSEIRMAFPEKKLNANIVSSRKENRVFNSTGKLRPAGKKPIDILYLINWSARDKYFGMSRPNSIDEFLFELQKGIIDKLAQYKNKNIMLKFPPGNLQDHPLFAFADKGKRAFFVESEPLTAIFRKYAFSYILMDMVSTPLVQSLDCDSRLLVFDNSCAPLTDDARGLLCKRAVVTSDKDAFIAHIGSIFDNTFPYRHINNNEFKRRYATVPVLNDSADIQELLSLVKR